MTIPEYAFFICNQQLRPNQSPTISRMGNYYRPRSSECSPAGKVITGHASQSVYASTGSMDCRRETSSLHIPLKSMAFFAFYTGFCKVI